jgi:hypothetical protein
VFLGLFTCVFYLVVVKMLPIHKTIAVIAAAFSSYAVHLDSSIENQFKVISALMPVI